MLDREPTQRQAVVRSTENATNQPGLGLEVVLGAIR